MKRTAAILLSLMMLSSCSAAESSSVNDAEKPVSSTTDDTSSTADNSEESQTDNESSEEELTDEPIDEPIDSELAKHIVGFEEEGLAEEEEENEGSFESGEAFEDSKNAEFLCEKNGFNADNLLPETDGSIKLNSVATYDTCYYLNYSDNDGENTFSVCVSCDKFNSLEELCESFTASDGGFSLPVKVTLDEKANAVITVTMPDDTDANEAAVNKLTEEGFMYTIFANDAGAEKLLGYAEKINF